MLAFVPDLAPVGIIHVAGRNLAVVIIGSNRDVLGADGDHHGCDHQGP